MFLNERLIETIIYNCAYLPLCRNVHDLNFLDCCKNDISLINNYSKLFIDPIVEKSVKTVTVLNLTKLSILCHTLHALHTQSCGSPLRVTPCTNIILNHSYSLMSSKSLPISLFAFTEPPDNDSQDYQQYYSYHNSYDNNCSTGITITARSFFIHRIETT